jgi:hypothetical protein
MKNFYHILRTITAVVLALLSGILVAGLGMIVYSTEQNGIGIVAIAFFLVMGLYIGHMVYVLVSEKGIGALGIFSKSAQFLNEDVDEGSDEEDPDEEDAPSYKPDPKKFPGRQPV